MKITMFLFKRETLAPMLALTFASFACVMLVGARIIWTHNVRHAFLVWNLFLAWLPLLFALLASDFDQRGARRNWRFAGLAAGWLVFFPNAPYIFTDLIHLTQGFYRYFWVDLSLLLLCALTGLVLGFVSLYLMQSLVTRAAGQLAGWIFVVVATGLSSFGIYLGRFLRFNSWDVLVQPAKLFHGISNWAANPLVHPASVAFPLLFAVFLFIAYVMLYALTHLKPAPAMTLRGSEHGPDEAGAARNACPSQR